MDMENHENEARKVLDKIFDDILFGENPNSAAITVQQIEENIRNQLDRFKLNISNYYRLRRYFIDKYKRFIKKVKK